MSLVDVNEDWLPPYFEYREGQFWLEQVSLTEVALQYGTPAYVYSARSIREAYRRYQAAFDQAHLPMSIFYAVKANSNLAILGLLAAMGAGADVVSAGELYRATEAGFEPDRILFTGVGKTADEIDFALSKSIKAFQIESVGEVALIEARAKILQKTANIAIRVNPDVGADTHPYITTGLSGSKFGVTIEQVPELARSISRSGVMKLRGLQIHIGSQLLKVQPVITAFQRLLKLAGEVETLTGQALEYLDIGGGLGVSYQVETPQSPDKLANALAAVMSEQGRTYKLLTEPGRYIVAEAGALLTTVLYLKSNDAVNFAIVDAAMNDLIRPALYGAKHKVRPLQARNLPLHPTPNYTLVGPVCESGDWLAREVQLAHLAEGSQLALLSAGAYGSVMSSNYNSRLRAPEILVDGSQTTLIRRRETLADLLATERLAND